ncbi:MAG: hypothetical protein MUC59_16845 [Saprospiraceae bacterium]|jgi:hypothetical protein|nr:hypothetical protein [Saprospiraceae bacterium]
MKNILIFGLILASLTMGCKNDPPDNTGTTTTPETSGSTTAIDPSTIKFICQSAAEPNTDGDAPRHEVFLQIGSSKVKVADILNCEILNKESYEQNQIPPTAIAAVGGWWAGAGDYLYLIEEGGNYVVKKGFIGEEMEGNNFDYKAVMSFDKNGNEVF